jgi:hypothetical protein
VILSLVDPLPLILCHVHEETPSPLYVVAIGDKVMLLFGSVTVSDTGIVINGFLQAGS